MIGRSKVGKGFYGCISYNLNDKRELSDEDKLRIAQDDGLQHKDRAEVLYYNRCYGNAAQLSKECNRVVKQNDRVVNPVFHFSLRLAPGDSLSKEQWVDIAQKLAREFNFQDNQYMVILHKDTPEQHIHIVANRVGFYGKVASDRNNYRRTAEFCRRIEKEYRLTEVQSPRQFQTQEQRQQQRHDSRKERLRVDIAQTLSRHSTYQGFEQGMKDLGYQVLKGRGISFIDDKKVMTKGSEVGFSLATIEKVLCLNSQRFEKLAELERLQKQASAEPEMPRPVTATEQLLARARQEHRHKSSPAYMVSQQIDALTKTVGNLLQGLVEPVYASQSIDPEFHFKQKKKKKQSQRPS
ncbi:relaxase/mobilization nuclease domain-containing protein [Paraflavitalea sp. CAU 1676]|uniref:relaxase/mobilization nuclease domain-containing protein n=1 Tax=Paraflavitalea sp. CAU 1676 TaxID=3032598 RepID=UPI0023D98970|nr:relaxase/mobilization nuclease domain-containing protein [Paraflavitalea sp. CAU 1676]MDF2189828.1 relaxase/mobilization nuclease domain-containing protein [Paraflavitalea sp. CAU 1676]